MLKYERGGLVFHTECVANIFLKNENWKIIFGKNEQSQKFKIFSGLFLQKIAPGPMEGNDNVQLEKPSRQNFKQISISKQKNEFWIPLRCLAKIFQVTDWWQLPVGVNF